jgi:hypothetical protein
METFSVWKEVLEYATVYTRKDVSEVGENCILRGINIFNREKNKNKLRGLSERTIPIERPSIVGEVSANVCG